MIRIRRGEGAQEKEREGRKGSFLGVRRKVDECADLGRKQGNATFYTGGIKLAREKKRKWRMYSNSCPSFHPSWRQIEENWKLCYLRLTRGSQGRDEL